MNLVQKKNICYLCCMFLETNDSSNFELKIIQGIHLIVILSSIVSLILMTKGKEDKAPNT